VTGDFRKLHNEEFRNLYSSPDVIRVIKSRRMRWAVQVACLKAMWNCTKFFVVKL